MDAKRILIVFLQVLGTSFHMWEYTVKCFFVVFCITFIWFQGSLEDYDESVKLCLEAFKVWAKVWNTHPFLMELKPVVELHTI